MSLGRVRYEPLGAHGPIGETHEGTVVDLLFQLTGPELRHLRLGPSAP